MKIYTSYFAKVEKLKSAGIVPIGISLWPPRFFSGTSLSIVAPKRYMLNDKLSEEEYIKMYYEDVLRFVEPKSFIKDLERVGGRQDVALCCFEKPGDFCHRHLLAEWLKDKARVEVVEFGVSLENIQKSKQPKVEQQSLF